MENNGNIISFDQIRTSPKYDLVNLCTELSDDHDINIRSGDDAPFSKNLNCNYYDTEDFPSLSNIKKCINFLLPSKLSRHI